jgi:hypothetical protein
MLRSRSANIWTNEMAVDLLGTDTRNVCTACLRSWSIAFVQVGNDVTKHILVSRLVDKQLVIRFCKLHSTPDRQARISVQKNHPLSQGETLTSAYLFTSSQRQSENPLSHLGFKTMGWRSKCGPTMSHSANDRICLLRTIQISQMPQFPFHNFEEP